LSIRKLLKYFDDLESEKRVKKRKKKKSGTLEQHRQGCRNNKEKGEKKKKRREKINSREKKNDFSRIESEFQIHPEQEDREETLTKISKKRDKRKRKYKETVSQFEQTEVRKEQLAKISKNRKLKCEETVSQIEQTKERKKLKIPDSTVRHEEVIFFCYFYIYFLAKINSDRNNFLP
jgi:hypothetical protein